MGAAVERVLHKLSGVKPIGNGWVARCPAHDDKVQSLQISERTDQSVGLHCHAGCPKDALLQAMGLQFGDLYESADKGKQIVATYDYRALDGTLLYQAVRFFPKEFRQRRPEAGRLVVGYASAQGETSRLPVTDLKGHNIVVVVEGEKDADRLWALGIAATCNIGGALKWGTAETKSLVAAGSPASSSCRTTMRLANDTPNWSRNLVKLANLMVSVMISPTAVTRRCVGLVGRRP